MHMIPMTDYSVTSRAALIPVARQYFNAAEGSYVAFSLFALKY